VLVRFLVEQTSHGSILVLMLVCLSVSFNHYVVSVLGNDVVMDG